jgi:hypothetical protein
MIGIAITPVTTKSTLLDWYVDSVSGDDGNDGKSAGAALATLAGLVGESLASGDKIGLAAASTWLEELDLSALDNVSIQSYGAGNRPIISGADVIDSGDWSKTAGRTNVYECSQTLEETGITDPWINIFEDDIHFTNVADQATCDSTPASYYIAGHDTTPFTLYIHTSGSDDPGSNGSTYNYSNRNRALEVGDSCAISGLELLRARGGSGSLKAGRSVSVSNCHVKDGSKHNAYAEDGASFANCTFHIAYWGASTPVLAVLNENTPVGLGGTFRNCTFSQDTYSLSTSLFGLYWHKNTSGDFGNILVDNCTFDKLHTGIDVGLDCDLCTVSNTTVTATVRPFRSYKPLVLDTCVITNGSATGGQIVKINADTTLTISGCTITSTVNLTGGSIHMGGYACTVTATGSTWVGQDSGSPGFDNIFYCTDSDPTITFTTNTVTDWTRVTQMGANTPTIDFDFNTYTTEPKFQYDNTAYNTLADWQSGESQDLNSTGP